jgi:DNA helicase IV
VSDAVLAAELSREQAVLDGLYARLDELTTEAGNALLAVERAATAGTPAAHGERDAFARLHSERLAQLRSVHERLCFGRLDLTGGARHYIGRIGLPDRVGGRLLLDWRAPGAEAFYRATSATPMGVVRRRHLATTARRMTGIEDDVLDLDAFAGSGLAEGTVSGEGAFLAALGAARTGHMRDIVATIQGEQDRIIRAPLAGVLVVQGGPGTGKTAVALHRTAYLLYAHRDRIAKAGVLLVGPNRRFLRYIEQVLPALGETGVLTATPGQLYPGLDATATEDPAVAVLKGDLRMARVLAGAVRDRQRVPSGTRTLDVDGTPVTMTPGDVQVALHRARTSRKPHNGARVVFVTELLDRLAARLATAQGGELDADNRADLLAELRGARDVRREVNLCWMPLSPEQLVTDLLADPRRLASAAPMLSADERALLRRDRGRPWTSADVPLLDEAAELLGEDDAPARLAAARAAAERAVELEYARGVLQMSGQAAAMMSADTLVDRYAAPPQLRSAADRAAHDRTWAFGHVVVDEAQELSAMQWRLLMRRCPSRSMTVVGDIAQTGSDAGASSWGQVLDRYVAGRWVLEELTVNYRTPGLIMGPAVAMLRAAGVELTPPVSARDGDFPPRVLPIQAGGRALLLQVVRDELALGTAQLAVITPASERDEVARAVAGVVPPEGAEVHVLAPGDAKGLEFDAVVVLEPADIVSAAPHGAQDLYVAMTRPTQRLTLLHSAPLPPGTGGQTG